MIPIALLLLHAFMQSLSPEAVEHAKAGLFAQKDGRMPDAILEFKKVTELAPTLPAAFVNLGAAYLQVHDYGSAVPPLRKALELNPDLTGAQQMLGFALVSQGYAGEALPYLERAHEDGILGVAELAVGKFPEAITHLSAALTKHPNDPELLYYLGRASGLLSKEAMDMLEAAYPNEARTHQALAENYAALKRVPDSEKEYLNALRLRPEAPGIHRALGQLYAATADWPKAEEQFRAEAVMQPGDPETAYSLGNALLQEGKAKDARQELERANRLRREMPETLYALGKADLMDGARDDAEKAWKEVLRIEKAGPLAAQAHFALAGLYRKAGKSGDAQREMEEFNRIQNSPTEK